MIFLFCLYFIQNLFLVYKVVQELDNLYLRRLCANDCDILANQREVTDSKSSHG